MSQIPRKKRIATKAQGLLRHYKDNTKSKQSQPKSSFVINFGNVVGNYPPPLYEFSIFIILYCNYIVIVVRRIFFITVGEGMSFPSAECRVQSAELRAGSARHPISILSFRAKRRIPLSLLPAAKRRGFSRSLMLPQNDNIRPTPDNCPAVAFWLCLCYNNCW